MKSKIYSENKGVFRKGQVWLPALAAIGFLLAFPVAELISLGNWESLGYSPEELAMSYMGLWKKSFLYTGMAVALASALINALNSFWYLYSPAKVDFYHCLPVSRKRMFAEKALTGVKYYLFPYVVMEFLAVCIGASRGFFSLELMSLAVKMLAIHLVMYLTAYFAVTLAVCLTGNLLMGVLTMGGIFLYGPALAFVLNGYGMEFFRTYWGPNELGGLQFLFQCSPLTLDVTFIDKYSRAQACAGYFLLLVLAAVIFAAASCFAYLKRPVEEAGKSVVYRFMEYVMYFMVVIPAGLGIGLIFHAIPTGTTKEAWWIFGLVSGTVLIHGILQVVFRLDFRSFFSGKKAFILSAVCVAVCALVFRQDLTGYDSYLPAYEKLEGIAVRANDNLEDGKLVKEKEDGSYRLISEMERTEEGLSMSPEIYQALERIVENQNLEKGLEWNRTFDVKYRLKSGKETYRRYRYSMSSSEDYRVLKKALYETGNLKEYRYSFLNIDEKYLEGVSGGFWDNRDYALFQNDGKKQRELAEALKEDVKEAAAGELFELPCASLRFFYKAPVEQPDGIVDTDANYGYAAFVYPGFKRTVAILKETGYPLSIDEVEMESVSYTVFQINGYNWDELLKGTVEEPSQLEEMKQAMVPYGLFPDWLEYERYFDAEIHLTEGRGICSARIIKDRIPSFIRERMENAGIFEDTESGELDVQVNYE